MNEKPLGYVSISIPSVISGAKKGLAEIEVLREKELLKFCDDIRRKRYSFFGEYIETGKDIYDAIKRIQLGGSSIVHMEHEYYSVEGFLGCRYGQIAESLYYYVKTFKKDEIAKLQNLIHAAENAQLLGASSMLVSIEIMPFLKID